MKLSSRLFDVRRTLSERFHDRWYRLVGPYEMAAAKRQQSLHCRTYIAITGSSGKSTTALLARTILAGFGSLAAGNLINNERAALRTLRKLRAPTDFVVQEVSAHGGPDSLRPLTNAIRIDVGIVTAVGKEHRAAYPDIDAIATEKSRIVSSVHAGGLSLLNADDPLVRAMAAVAGGRILLFGTSLDADVRAENVSAHWPGRLAFDLVIRDRRWPVATRFAGTMMLTNVLAALAMAHGLGLDIPSAIARIATIEPVPEHMSLHEGKDGHTYLLDTNKAPLWGTDRLVKDLPRLKGDHTIFILAQISDTFGNPSQWYRKLLRNAARDVDQVIAMGKSGDQASKIITTEGAGNIQTAATISEVRAILATMPPSLVVIKSAEVAKLSRIWLAADRPITCARVACHLKVACRNCPLLTESQAA